MKIAEALALRADARIQEGGAPEEDPKTVQWEIRFRQIGSKAKQ
jgi:hypothetical protein